MGSIYDKPVRQLMSDMIEDLDLRPGQVIDKNRIRSWFRDKYPKIKDGTVSAHLIRLSVNAPSRVHHNPKPGEDDLFYQIDGSHFRRYSEANDPTPIYPGSVPERPPHDGPEDADQPSEFAYEKDLQNFLSKNLTAIEPGLSLYEEEGIKGIEYPVGGRFIDILAVDSNNDWVVLELKVSRGYDRVVGQILRYIAWIKTNLADEGQKVRGVIVARDISEDLLLACSQVSDISLYEYSLSVSLKRVSE